MNVVGFVGFKQSGKDTAAQALVEHRGFTRIGFADAVKDMALAIDPLIFVAWRDRVRLGIESPYLRLRELVNLVGMDSAKSVPMVREFLQRLGTEGVRDIIGKDAWVKAWHKKARDIKNNLVVVPDVRFFNEASYLWREFGALIIRIERPGQDIGDQHDSEQEQTHIQAQMTVSNHKDVQWLHKGVLTTYDLWMERV